MDWEEFGETNEDFIGGAGLETKLEKKGNPKPEHLHWILHVAPSGKRTPRLETPLANYKYRVFACAKYDDNQLLLDEYNFKRLLSPKISFDKKNVADFCKYYEKCTIKKNCEFSQVATYLRKEEQ